MSTNNPSSSTKSAEKKALQFKMINNIFQALIRTEQDPQKKNKSTQVFQKMKQLSNPSIVRELDPESLRKIVQIKKMIMLYRNAFEKITDSNPLYRQFAIAEGKILQTLIQIQQKVQPKDYRTSYARALTFKKKDFGWTKQFIIDWSKEVQEQKKIQQEKYKQKNAQKSKSTKNQSPPEPPQVQSQNQNQQQQVVPIQATKTQQKAQVTKPTPKSVQKLPGQKPQKKVKKDETATQKPQKQKKAPKPKKQIDQSDSEQNEAAKQARRKKIEKQIKQRLQQRFQKPREPKDRVKSLMQYLQNRKDLSSLASNPSKLKEIAEFLNHKLEKFMKHHLSNLIDIAKLRNRKHQTIQSSGNQFTYFSRQGYTSMKPTTTLKVSQQPAAMLKLNYRSKFQLYSLLRMRQQALEQQLLRQFASKRDEETANRSDKKLFEYLLRPNQVIEKTENFIEMEENTTDRISIEIAHVRYLFQSHKFISKSWLMMNCYNS